MLDKLKELSLYYEELEQKIQDPEFIANNAEYARTLKEMGNISRKVETYREYEALLGRKREAEEIISGEQDAELVFLAREELEELQKKEESLLERLRGLMIQDDEYTGKNLIIEIRAGTGGDEASLFASDLFKIYQKFADNNGLKVEILSSSPSEVGGFKELIFSVSGKDCWSRFRFESGGHRVQRVPTTESQGRIHTSAATVAVLPEGEDVEIDFHESDLKIDTYRSSGPGGQNVNKVSSAIRITHMPTGLIVQCQDESSQHKNKAKALRILKARLYDIEMSQRKKERADERKSQIGSGDRNMRIRTYNYPQNRITDHRIKTNYSLEMIINGNLNNMVEDLTKWETEEKIKFL